jgi:sugar phosphate isomerase/epimerase
MPRPVILFSGGWADVPLEEFAARAGDWGYQGLELSCWGDHFEVQRALSEDDYCQKKLELLARHDLQPAVLGNYRVGQAVCDPIERRHKRIVPDYVWGDGDPDGVRQRATQEMVATVQAAQKLGVGVVSALSGSPLWAAVTGYPRPTAEEVTEGLQAFAEQWGPILDACREVGIRFAVEVHPGGVAFDLYSAEAVLDVLGGREEFGFTVDPSHLHWQGVDPAQFIRRFADRIFHVHMKDIALTLDGRSGVLNAYHGPGDSRRGWEYRAPGHGGVDWESLIRALNAIGYDGPLAVEFSDAGMQRDYGAEEACRFVKRLDFEHT